MAYKGRFQPKAPNKYKGDPTRIIYRSLWELKLMKYLDSHEDVLFWSSEEFSIPYRSPIDGRMHRYFPDFWVKKKNRSGIIEQVVIEVKPQKHIDPPKTPKRKTRRYMGEMARHAVNMRKFEVAERFCDERGMKFQLITEKELNIK
jgi:hypothetical protein